MAALINAIPPDGGEETADGMQFGGSRPPFECTHFQPAHSDNSPALPTGQHLEQQQPEGTLPSIPRRRWDREDQIPGCSGGRSWGTTLGNSVGETDKEGRVAQSLTGSSHSPTSSPFTKPTFTEHLLCAGIGHVVRKRQHVLCPFGICGHFTDKKPKLVTKLCHNRKAKLLGTD